METESSQVRAKDPEEIGQQIINSPSTIKQEMDTEDQHGLSLLEGIEFESTIKAENCTESDGYPAENLVKSELDEFRNNPSNSPHDILIAVTLEKILKTETKILDGQPQPPGPDNEDDCNEEYNDPYSNVNCSDADADSNSDPERDPFADVDCDPCLSQKPPPQSDFPIGSATQVKSIKNARRFDANAISSSSNPSPSPNALNKRKRLNNNLQCQLCDEPQHSKSKLKSHLEICEASHQNRRRFCELCNILFSVPQYYRQHALKIHGIKDAKKPCLVPFQCQFCTRRFRFEESLILHVATHPQSSRSPANDGDLKPLRPSQCQEPPATFSNSSGLRNHIMKSKKNDRPFKCPLPNCEKADNLSSNLKDHLRIAHSKEKPFKCQERNCRKSFESSYQLHRHTFSHSEEKPFKCPHADCDRSFKSKVGITKHLQGHAGGTRRYSHITERPFKCDQCSRAFRKNWQLTVHLKLVHPKDDERFECPEPNCETTFKYKHYIKLHFAAFHTGKQTSFTCPEPKCIKSFRTEKSVQEHFRTHTRPEKCTEPGCSATFSRARFLNSHIKSKHKK